MFAVGSVCRVKSFTSMLRNVANVSLMTKRLKRRCGSGRDNSQKTTMLRVSTLVKRWDKCISVGGGYVEKQMFSPGPNITCFTFYIHLWPIYWPSLIYIVTCYGSQAWAGDVRRLFLTPTRRVSWYPRRVIKGSAFSADYSLFNTALTTVTTLIIVIPHGTYNSSSWYIFSGWPMFAWVFSWLSFTCSRDGVPF
jgi:hypothetical protein